jgi:arginyl-tRNA synthetase
MNYVKKYITEKITDWLLRQDKETREIQFDIPKLSLHGDLTTNLAMTMAKEFRKAPRAIAEQLVSDIEWDINIIEKVEIAGPGFINFFISKYFIAGMLSDILRKKESYGLNDSGKGKSALVEFVSANPTGPLTIGHGRQAVLGDVVSSLLEACGYKVEREYYFNDAGRQMRVLANSVRMRYLELCGEKIDFPDDHYQGEYIIEIARDIFKEHGASLKGNENIDIFKEKAESVIFSDIKKTLKRLRIEFDRYFNEKSLYEEGKIEKMIEALRDKGLTYEKDGALWFKTSELGFEQDRVIVKSTGEPTYRLPDMAYHNNKFQREYDLIIDIFGSDHIDTYPDVLAAMKVLGWDVSKVKVLIHQFVTLYEGDKVVKMSTRKANFVTLDELMDDVGVDVTRYFFIMRNMNSHLNFDLKLAKAQSDENPVYYTQYAHARISSIFRKAEEENINIADNPDLNLLTEESEQELIKHLTLFPDIVLEAALNYEPHRITNYLKETSALFHRFYQRCRVVGEEEKLMQARFALLKAVKQVIYNGLNLLHISAPEKM